MALVPTARRRKRRAADLNEAIITLASDLTRLHNDAIRYDDTRPVFCEALAHCNRAHDGVQADDHETARQELETGQRTLQRLRDLLNRPSGDATGLDTTTVTDEPAV